MRCPFGRRCMCLAAGACCWCRFSFGYGSIRFGSGRSRFSSGSVRVISILIGSGSRRFHFGTVFRVLCPVRSWSALALMNFHSTLFASDRAVDWPPVFLFSRRCFRLVSYALCVGRRCFSFCRRVYLFDRRCFSGSDVCRAHVVTHSLPHSVYMCIYASNLIRHETVLSPGVPSRTFQQPFLAHR